MTRWRETPKGRIAASSGGAGLLSPRMHGEEPDIAGLDRVEMRWQAGQPAA
jgi:hypothetical protein